MLPRRLFVFPHWPWDEHLNCGTPAFQHFVCCFCCLCKAWMLVQATGVNWSLILCLCSSCTVGHTYLLSSSASTILTKHATASEKHKGQLCGRIVRHKYFLANSLSNIKKWFAGVFMSQKHHELHVQSSFKRVHGSLCAQKPAHEISCIFRSSHKDNLTKYKVQLINGFVY